MCSPHLQSPMSLGDLLEQLATTFDLLRRELTRRLERLGPNISDRTRLRRASEQQERDRRR